MIRFVNAAVYLVLIACLLTTSFNFFHPVTAPAAAFLSAASVVSAVYLSKRRPFRLFAMQPKRRPPFRTLLLLAIFATVWGLAVALRPTTGIDANVYHLPVALFMNHSRWYPGVAFIASHYGKANGTAILASLSTAFGRPGLENIPCVVVWYTYGAGMYAYLRRRNVGQTLAAGVVGTILLSPYLFYEAYNMGTDLPAVCFLTFGLLAFSEMLLGESVIFFAMAAVFKPLGIVALAFVGAYCILLLFGKKAVLRSLVDFRVLLALFTAVLIRIRVCLATGNPLYPFVIVAPFAWGLPASVQAKIVAQIRSYSHVSRSLRAMPRFLLDFTLRPKAINSSPWFVPLFAACTAGWAWLRAKKECKPRIAAHGVAVGLLCALLVVVWWVGSPIFRFIAGVLAFAVLIGTVAVAQQGTPRIIRRLLYGAMLLTIAAFSFNAARRFWQIGIPLINADGETFYAYVPFKPSCFTEHVTDDGFVYTRSCSTWCYRSRPPCINTLTIGPEEDVISAFRRYNGLEP